MKLRTELVLHLSEVSPNGSASNTTWTNPSDRPPFPKLIFTHKSGGWTQGVPESLTVSQFSAL